MCMDVSIQAVDLFKRIEPMIQKMEEEEKKPVVPQVHKSISNLREFTETFAIKFQKGANAEYVSKSQELFEIMHGHAKQIEHRNELGGHSAVWATRSQREGCQVFAAAQSSKTIEAELRINSDNLIWPQNEINALQAGLKFNEDIHLVLEYNEGDTILGGRFTAPRSNRFYFDVDPNGGTMKQIEVYHQLQEESHQTVKRHMFGGYQQMQHLTHAEIEQRMLVN